MIAPNSPIPSKNFAHFNLFLEDVKTFQSRHETSEKSSLSAEFLGRLTLKLTEMPSEADVAQLFKFQVEDSLGKIHKKKWKRQEKILLAWSVYHFLQIHGQRLEEMTKENWDFIARILAKETTECTFKFHSMIASQIQINEWTPEEDKLLFGIVRSNQKKSTKIKWIEVAREFYQRSSSNVFRNEKTCREHWISHLDPTLNKASWSTQEDVILIKGFQVYQTKWSQIALNLNGRNPYSVKNRFYSLCAKFGLQKNSETIKEDLEKILFFLAPKKKVHVSQKSSVQPNLVQNYRFLPQFANYESMTMNSTPYTVANVPQQGQFIENSNNRLMRGYFLMPQQFGMQNIFAPQITIPQNYNFQYYNILNGSRGENEEISSTTEETKRSFYTPSQHPCKSQFSNTMSLENIDPIDKYIAF